ncbi:MAG: hypothetical protein K0R15_96 [Clostridiales bacterium]|nr:hypothetical protein [Clostridiales bacterium]
MKLPEFIKKIGIWRLAIFLIAGVALMLLSNPGGGKDNVVENPATKTQNIIPTTEEDAISELENRLKEVLSKVAGVGKVEVMITLKSSKELVINKDKQIQSSTSSEKDSEGGERTTNSLTNSENTIMGSTDEPYVLKEMEPTINGIIIVAEGGDSIIIKNELTIAAQALFDVPVHKIKVMKMTKN